MRLSVTEKVEFAVLFELQKSTRCVAGQVGISKHSNQLAGSKYGLSEKLPEQFIRPIFPPQKGAFK